MQHHINSLAHLRFVIMTPTGSVSRWNRRSSVLQTLHKYSFVWCDVVAKIHCGFQHTCEIRHNLWLKVVSKLLHFLYILKGERQERQGKQRGGHAATGLRSDSNPECSDQDGASTRGTCSDPVSQSYSCFFDIVDHCILLTLLLILSCINGSKIIYTWWDTVQLMGLTPKILILKRQCCKDPFASLTIYHLHQTFRP